MPATIHIVAKFRAKEGKEDALKRVLNTLVTKTRRELGCYQYDLLQSSADPRDFCMIERWDREESLAQHMASAHFTHAIAELKDLTEGAPAGSRYALV